MKTCDWVIYHDETEDPPTVCGRKAVAVFSMTNQQKGPTEPERLEYPRCKRHYTEAAVAFAGIHGYDIEDLAE